MTQPAQTARQVEVLVYVDPAAAVRAGKVEVGSFEVVIDDACLAETSPGERAALAAYVAPHGARLGMDPVRGHPDVLLAEPSWPAVRVAIAEIDRAVRRQAIEDRRFIDAAGDEDLIEWDGRDRFVAAPAAERVASDDVVVRERLARVLDERNRAIAESNTFARARLAAKILAPADMARFAAGYMPEDEILAAFREALCGPARPSMSTLGKIARFHARDMSVPCGHPVTFDSGPLEALTAEEFEALEALRGLMAETAERYGTDIRVEPRYHEARCSTCGATRVATAMIIAAVGTRELTREYVL